MNAKEYQDLAARTLIENPGEFTHQEIMTIWGGMGLAGEAGEVAECIKKGIFHRHGLDREKLIKELGDVCWYLAAICTVQNIDLGDVMQANIDKLQTRYPDGFSTADSVKRVDVSEPWSWTCECGKKRFEPGSCEVCLMGYTAPLQNDAPKEPAEMCQRGHEKSIHRKGILACWHTNSGNGFDCPYREYPPIPALLRGEQPPLFDTDK